MSALLICLSVCVIIAMFAWFFGGEQLSERGLAGCVLVLSGVWVSSKITSVFVDNNTTDAPSNIPSATSTTITTTAVGSIEAEK